MKSRAKLFPVAVFLLAVAVYTALVTPRRFFQCLGAPARYLARDDPARSDPAAASIQAGLSGAVPGNRVRLLVNGDEALPAMLEHIDGAQESIRWQVMLFQPDEAGSVVAEALARAARRGVTVQLSFDLDQTVNGTVASRHSREEKARLNREMNALLDTMRAAGVEVRASPPGLDFPLDGVPQDARRTQEDIARSACIAANHYDHRKLTIIDDRVAIIGGLNVGRSYLYRIPPDLTLDMLVEAQQRRAAGQPEGWEKWLDSAAVIEGPAAVDIAAEFDWRWQVLGGSPLPPPRAVGPVGDTAVQFLRQRPGLHQAGTKFFDLVAGAETEIYVASPFVSYDPALQALQDASRRGVRVVFVVPNERNEMQLSARIFRQSAGALVDSGVELYFNNLRMAHTKMMVVDGRQVMLGSVNLNYRSFWHDLEAAVVVQDAAFARETIERVFLPVLALSDRVTSAPREPWNPLDWLMKPFT